MHFPSFSDSIYHQPSLTHVHSMTTAELAEDFLSDEALQLVTDKEICLALVSKTSHSYHTISSSLRRDFYIVIVSLLTYLQTRTYGQNHTVSGPYTLTTLTPSPYFILSTGGSITRSPHWTIVEERRRGSQHRNQTHTRSRIRYFRCCSTTTIATTTITVAVILPY